MNPRLLRLLVVGGMLCPLLSAREFRSLRPVRKAGPEARLPPGAEQVAVPDPVPATSVQKAVSTMVDQWNKTGMENVISDQFYDKTRLLEAVDEKAPRDASMAVLGVRDVKTLSQHRQVDAQSGTQTRTSRVTATVRTQITYTDAAKGVQRIEGTNEFIMDITEETGPDQERK